MTYRVPMIPQPFNGTVSATDRSSDVRIALPVREAHFRPIAMNANWLNGRGGQLVGCGHLGTASAGSSTDYPFYLWPSTDHDQRLWCIALSAGGESRGTITLNPAETGDTYDFSISSSRQDRPLMFNFLQNDSTSAEGGVQLRVTPDSGMNSVHIHSVGVFEVPRTKLPSGTTTIGAQYDSLRKGQPIFENTSVVDKISAQGVWAQIEKAKTNARRKKLFDWSVEEDSGVVVTASSFTGTSNIFDLDPAVQCRLLETSTTVRTVDWAVWAKTSGGALTGEVRVTAASGDSNTISVSGSTGQWYTGTIDVETDDWGQGDLVRGGTRDTLAFEARKTSTTTNIELCGLAVGEVD